MSFNRQGWFFVLASLGGCALLAGCQGTGPVQHIARAPAPPAENLPKLTVAQQADLQVAFARTLEKTGTGDQAIATYEDALRKDPKRADALDRLAVINARKGQFDQAVVLHKKAVALQPNNADFVCNLGYCYYLQQRWAEAEMQFRKAVELAPTHSRAMNNLGLVLARTERTKEALTAFRRAGCSEADAHSNLAFGLTLQNSYKDAQQHYARAHQLDPASGPAEKGLRVVNAQLSPPEVKTVAPAKAVVQAPREQLKAPVAIAPVEVREFTPAQQAPVQRAERITRVPSDPSRQLIELEPESAPEPRFEPQSKAPAVELEPFPLAPPITAEIAPMEFATPRMQGETPRIEMEAPRVQEAPVQIEVEAPRAQEPARMPMGSASAPPAPPALPTVSASMPEGPIVPIQFISGVRPMTAPKSLEAPPPPAPAVVPQPQPAPVKQAAPVQPERKIIDMSTTPIQHVIGTTPLQAPAAAVSPAPAIEQLIGVTPKR
jgi:Flp pilus assembly protein TadD